MSNNDNEYKGSTIKQLILVIPGAILAFTLLISLIAKTSSVVGTPPAEVPQAVVAQLEENIKPVASVEVAAADAGPHVDKSGEEVVKAVCSMCHAAGLMNAPKIGDKGQWGPRIAQGYDILISHAINGIRSMPARGGNAALTDGEIANAVANMANQAGANFTPPAPKAAAADAKAVEAGPADAKAAVAVVATTAAVVASPAKKVDEKKAEVTKTAPAAVAEKVAAPVVVADAAPAAAKGKSGQEVYKAVCSMCHAGGLMGAPKFGDKEQWAPRIAQGHDTLVSHALKGIRMMPAKGGNAGLSDDEVAGAVKYMANEAGAGF
jgi:cytochrome c5